MSDPTVRESIISDLAVALGKVLAAYGYSTDAGERVFVCRKSIKDSEVPCMVIHPGMELGIKIIDGFQSCSMQVTLDYHATYTIQGIYGVSGIIPGSAALASLRAQGDMIKAVFGQVVSSKIDHIIYDNGGTEDIPEEGETSTGIKVVGTKLVFTIHYDYLVGNPFSQ